MSFLFKSFYCDYKKISDIKSYNANKDINLRIVTNNCLLQNKWKNFL